MKKPIIEEQLLQYLSEMFPDQVPNINDHDREVWAQVGVQRVIRHLKGIYEEQNENILTREVL
jgi:hypothetical protein